MYELFIIAATTLVILVFVPLEKIGKAQERVKAQIKKWTSKD